MNTNTPSFQPAYLNLAASGELSRRVDFAYQRLNHCELCAVRCRVDRRTARTGSCRTGMLARLSGYGPHLGEEDPLRGWRGSGTIFFAGCNLRCQYCQNFKTSQTDEGEEVEPDRLALAMLELQDFGCHNINLVSPSHVVPQILAALQIAAQAGLRLPLVYNTGGYDSIDTLRLLDGVIDIYMPDMKYGNPQTARRYSKVIQYPMVNQENVREMHRQVGDLQIDENGLARRGLLVRHLVLPNKVAGTESVVEFLADQISRDTCLNLMNQYRPVFQAHLYPALNRPTKPEEYQTAVEAAHAAGLRRLYHDHH